MAEKIARSISSGDYGPGDRLPGERELAQALGLSRTTVSAAYGRLRDDGFLTGGRGASARTSLPGEAPTGGSRGLTEARTSSRADEVLDLTAAVLPADPSVHAAYVRALERLPTRLPGHGYEASGVEALREAVQAGAGCLLISHDEAFVSETADRIGVLAQGRAAGDVERTGQAGIRGVLDGFDQHAPHAARRARDRDGVEGVAGWGGSGGAHADTRWTV